MQFLTQFQRQCSGLFLRESLMDLKEAKIRIEDDGYCVLENQLEPREAERLDGLARPFMDHNEGYINLEGALNYIPDLAPLCIHPLLLELAECILGEGFVLPNVCMKWCKPGAGAGGLHADWPLGNMQKPWPKSPTLIQIFWMLTDFTVENGATRVVPFNHHTRRAPTLNRTYSQEIPVVGKRDLYLSSTTTSGIGVALIPPVTSIAWL